MDHLSVLDLAGRLVVSTVAGAVIGLERERRGHVAGLRTHALAALGAALFTLAGAYGFSGIRPASADPSRVGAQVATGIGFVGAGAVLRHGLAVRGLTTAATLWLTAALGVAGGAGAYVAVAITTGISLATLFASGLKVVAGVSEQGLIEVEYERGHGTLGPLLRSLQEQARSIDRLDIDDDGDQSIRTVAIHLHADRLSELDEILEDVRLRPEVRSVRRHALS